MLRPQATALDSNEADQICSTLERVSDAAMTCEANETAQTKTGLMISRKSGIEGVGPLVKKGLTWVEQVGWLVR